jgi:hypothetical protein
MKARQVRVYLEDGAVVIAANPRARNLLVGNPGETNESREEGQVMKRAKGARGE